MEGPAAVLVRLSFAVRAAGLMLWDAEVER
jgi:hypothetical protein